MTTNMPSIAEELAALRPGDDVIVIDHSLQTHQRRVVGRIGRTLIHVGGVGTPMAFRRDTGTVVDRHASAGIVTPARFVYMQRVEAARKRLGDFGVSVASAGTAATRDAIALFLDEALRGDGAVHLGYPR